MVGSSWQPAVVDPVRPGGWALVHCRQQFLCAARGVLFSRDWLKAQLPGILAEHGVGCLDGEPVFVLELDRHELALPSGLAWKGLRQFMLEGDFATFRMLGYAAQIATWARQHRFCGSCGASLRQVAGERAMACPTCQLQQYPRLAPSIIVLIARGDELLLARSPRFVAGVYSTLAGFVEPGESIEACVRREVREEVAVEVGNLRYIASQSWPFPHSLMLGFHADYAGGEIVPQPEEIEDARWFHVDALPPLPARGSIARYLIDLHLARRSGAAEPVLPD
ncbi:NAD(+) diphosphatase [Pseudomonas stutzeri]|nr:NAD(+) diphosphatase [Stutzerimonas stutzeri]